MVRLTSTNMSNVNNLNGVSNFGHGEDIPIKPVETSIDEVESSSETEVKEKGKKKSK